MAEKTPAAPAADENEVTEVENRRLPGWPQLSTVPFVEPGYYDAFDKKVRPRFISGGAGSLNMTAGEVERSRDNWTRPWKLVTVFNFTSKDHTLNIPGPRPGQNVAVELPPYGIIRAPEACLPLNRGPEGSIFAQVYLVPRVSPTGDCRDKFDFADPKNPKQPIKTCPFYGCATHPSFGWVHSVHHAYHIVNSIGEAHAATAEVGGPSAYTPELKETSKRLLAYQELDPRQLVSAAIGRRLMELNQLETKIQEQIAAGVSVGGR